MPIPPVPQHCPTPVELDDLELLTTHALGDITAFNQPGSPVTLILPESVELQARAVGAVELVDPEGLPLAQVSWPGGVVDPLTHAQYGAFRELALPPAAYRETHAGRTVVPVTEPLSAPLLDKITALGPVTLLAFTGTGTSWLSPAGLVRATRAAAALLPDAVVVTAPLPSHGDVEADHALGVRVAEAYAAGDPIHALPADDSEDYPAEIAAVVDQDRPPADRQGLVVFLTGLSGSGKSTLARAFVDKLLEQGQRTVTSLDGDVVRRNLSAGLTFSKEDRETNIKRIGWVAAEIARHGGVAVVSPIAPFDATRRAVRQMVEDAGGAFFLVHVATPLEECERRDRKGLYAKARAGQIPEFTGISSPYEEPDDADVRVDTTGRTIEDALSDVLIGLREEGYVDLVAAPAPTGREPLKVLFVCTANICRSAAMELLARDAAGDADVVFDSAGVHGFHDHPMDDVVAGALPDGVDASAFRSKAISRELLDEADLVLTMEAQHRTYILDDRPELFRKVFTIGQFAHTLERAPADLDRAELLAHVGATRGNADPALDVADPYRRGPEAAAGCVARLQALLHAVLPALSS